MKRIFGSLKQFFAKPGRFISLGAMTIIIAGIVFVGATATGIVYTVRGQDGETKGKSSEQTEAPYKAKDLDAADAKQTASTQNEEQTPAKPAAQPIKYSTSSDPRSTEYSTTPPPPNPANIDIKITHNGQVAAGTLISYNATKSEKAYYGGDLVLSKSTVIINSGTAADRNITVSTPDGATITMPTSPWNDTNPNFGIGMDISQYKAEGTSFNMMITTSGALPVHGTYQLHITAHRTGQTADAWQYDAFITIQVL